MDNYLLHSVLHSMLLTLLRYDAMRGKNRVEANKFNMNVWKAKAELLGEVTELFHCTTGNMQNEEYMGHLQGIYWSKGGHRIAHHPDYPPERLADMVDLVCGSGEGAAGEGQPVSVETGSTGTESLLPRAAGGAAESASGPQGWL